jgi:uncharacterized protein YbjT (DUF2867 family)
MSKTIAIFGATGAQGIPVVKEALEKGHTVRAVARDAAKITSIHPDAIAVAADLSDEESVAKALDGVDAAFLHFPMPTGPDDHQKWAAAFFGAAHKVNLPLLVYVTSGPSGDRYPSSAIIDGTTQGMKAVLESGIPAVVLQPAVYLENLQPELFAPTLRSEGKLDYPPIPRTLKMQWTSHVDQAVLAVAALSRPDLAGQSFEIGTPQSLTGSELADLLNDWVGREVTFDPITPTEFGTRVGDALNNPGVAFALGDLYDAISKMDGDDMTIDTNALEETFDVKLSSVEEHIRNWPKA